MERKSRKSSKCFQRKNIIFELASTNDSLLTLCRICWTSQSCCEEDHFKNAWPPQTYFISISRIWAIQIFFFFLGFREMKR